MSTSIKSEMPLNEEAARNFFEQQLKHLKSSADVSRETLQDITIYIDTLKRWQTAKNLVSPSAFNELWQRHLIDGLHLRRARPDTLTWMDWGAGAGLPSVILAILLKNVANAHIFAVEANSRKCAFLNTVQRTLNLPLTVINTRIESLNFNELPPIDCLTARALAPLPHLIDWAAPLLYRKNIKAALFIKGENWQKEQDEYALPAALNLSNSTIFTSPTRLISVDPSGD